MGNIKGLITFALIATLAIAYTYIVYFQQEEILPIYQPYDINPALVDTNLMHVDDHRIMDFTLVNHLGDTVSLADVEGQILVVDFFFTRCATICPVMTSNLKLLHDGLSDGVRILSHSVTPVADSISVLNAYADKYSADASKWWFLTGDKTEVYKLARKSYFSCLDEGDGGYQDFVHTENVVLVDTEGRLRGFYDGTLKEEISQLYQDIQTLFQEKEKKK
jgi:protein SCO1/2